MDAIDAALRAIDAQRPGDQWTYKEIAEDYGVDRSTLSRRHRGITRSKADSAIAQRALHPQQEEELVQYIENLTERELAPTREMVADYAGKILRTTPLSLSWVDAFYARHKDALLKKTASGIDRVRHNADSHKKYVDYFSLVTRKLEEHGIEARNSYNMDEKGILAGLANDVKVIVS